MAPVLLCRESQPIRNQDPDDYGRRYTDGHRAESHGDKHEDIH
ncbi:hypothetical protein [Cupriavidus necator]|nr:hypothetical protein [Cupriavidus necator]